MNTAPALLGLLALAAGARADAPAWRLIDAGSRLGFVATWEGSEFEGEFRQFSADIRFAPDALETSRFDVTVDVTSADTGSRDRDAAMADPDWFHFARYPEARFVAERFEALPGDGGYVAVGELTLKGRSRGLRLPFDWQRDGAAARLRTEIVLQRTDFGIGEGEWAEGDIIGIDVRVVGELRLDAGR